MKPLEDVYESVAEEECQPGKEVLCKTTESHVGRPISTAGDTINNACACVCAHTRERMTDLSGICILKYGLCFSCVRMHVQFEFVQSAVWLRCV